ncbi:hypothetical protein EDC39_10824 [Geothermobacter ehrlichii]|uniref:CcmD family protein n=1 Tax=Geothermobacter ehrlichii TaxID=213224 RepID=A0A5D3WJN2_9BACT|nr:hypothetical protein [Geothermobacter ehrlichii]TYO98087.1 hypothetical protein EDC39_10824 [Geothermobacter ehrlichii]
MKRLLMIPLFLLTLAQPALAMTETGFDNIRFATLIACNVLAALAIFFCMLVLAAVAVDKLRDRKRQRAVVRVRSETPNRRRNQVAGH